MIMRDSDLTTMIQQQEEEKARKLMEKEQRAMTSTPTGQALLLVKRVLYLHYYSVLHTPEIWRRLKSNNLRNEQYVFSSRIVYSIYK